MTNNEAIEWIKDMQGWNWHPCERHYAEALPIAIEALEKQVSKKVNPRHIKKYDGYDDGWCPICDSYVLHDAFENNVYCGHCGQKLLWEDYEDED